MRKEVLIPLTAFGLAGCPSGPDNEPGDDCDPVDVVFFDGEDQDCDDEDEIPDYVGSWSLTSRMITAPGGYEEFEEYAESGSMTISDAGEATIDLDFVLGTDPPDFFRLADTLTDVEAASFSLSNLTGTFTDYAGNEYATEAAWTCTVDTSMTCTGTLQRGTTDPPVVSDATIIFDMN